MTARTAALTVVLSAFAVCAGLAFQQARRSPTPKPAQKMMSYKADVAPFMTKYCLPCHTEDMMNPSELYLDSYQSLMAGGKHGKSLVAGNPDSSLLVRKLTAAPPFGDPMPMKRKSPIPQDSLKILSQWIKQGAKNN